MRTEAIMDIGRRGSCRRRVHGKMFLRGGGWLGLRQRDLEVKVFSFLHVTTELRVPLFPISALSMRDQTGLSI